MPLRSQRGRSPSVIAAAMRKPKRQPSAAVSRLSSKEIQKADRMEGDRSLPRLSSVTCPCGLRKAPMTILSVGKIRNSVANRKNGATPSQLRWCRGRKAAGRIAALVVIGLFPGCDVSEGPVRARSLRTDAAYFTLAPTTLSQPSTMAPLLESSASTLGKIAFS
ncbi:hypothetical protein D9M72_592530 [compost metagenome]